MCTVQGFSVRVLRNILRRRGRLEKRQNCGYVRWMSIKHECYCVLHRIHHLSSIIMLTPLVWRQKTENLYSNRKPFPLWHISSDARTPNVCAATIECATADPVCRSLSMLFYNFRFASGSKEKTRKIAWIFIFFRSVWTFVLLFFGLFWVSRLVPHIIVLLASS